MCHSRGAEVRRVYNDAIATTTGMIVIDSR